MTLRHALFLFVLLAAVGACAPRQPHAVVGLLEDGVAAFVAQHPLAAGQVVRVDEVARTPAASYHVVQARGAAGGSCGVGGPGGLGGVRGGGRAALIGGVWPGLEARCKEAVYNFLSLC